MRTISIWETICSMMIPQSVIRISLLTSMAETIQSLGEILQSPVAWCWLDACIMGIGKGKAEKRWDCISNMAYSMSLAMVAGRRQQTRSLLEVSDCCGLRKWWYVLSINSEMFRLLNTRERLTSVKWLMFLLTPSLFCFVFFNYKSCWGRNNPPIFKMYINSKRKKKGKHRTRWGDEVHETQGSTMSSMSPALPCPKVSAWGLWMIKTVHVPQRQQYHTCQCHARVTMGFRNRVPWDWDRRGGLSYMGSCCGVAGPLPAAGPTVVSWWMSVQLFYWERIWLFPYVYVYSKICYYELYVLYKYWFVCSF